MSTKSKENGKPQEDQKLKSNEIGQTQLLIFDNESDKTDLEVLQYCSDLGIWKWNLVDNSVKFDLRWCEIIGYHINELEPHFSTFEKLIHPSDLTLVTEKVKNYLEGISQRFEVFFRLKHKEGHWVNILSKGKVFKTHEGVPYLFCGTHFDMSDVKKIEEKVEKIHQLSEDVQRMAMIGAWEVDVINSEIFWTDETYRIHDVPIGTKLKVEDGINFYIKEDQPRILKCVQDCITNRSTFKDDFQIRTAIDHYKWVRSYGEAFCNENGVVVKLRGTFQDISYQKELELSLINKNKDLILKEKDLETIIQCTNDGIWDWHIKENYEYMSPRFWEMLGYDPKEKKHNPKEWEEIIFPEDLILLNNKFEKHVQSKGNDFFFQEIRFNHKDGQTVWVLCRGRVVSWDKNGQPIRMVGAHTDITKLKEAQIRLQENSRLVALGEMAGGVAHEINNPLAIINSSAEALYRILEKQNFENPMSKKFIENIQHTVTRISKIIEGLKKLSRQSADSEMETCSIHTIIMDALSLCTEKFKSQGVELNVEIYDNYNILCRPVELSQVIINLLNNAFYAVKKEQNAMVTLSIKDIDESTLSIEIQDNGHGIPDSIKEKIMQPFFTTKPAGEGTGIGLSISREIISSMGGMLRLGSSSDAGTCFCIDLKKSILSNKANKAS